MLTEKAATFLNRVIQGEISYGMTSFLVDHLRLGNAAHISQETWEVLATWLESGCKRPKGRPPTGESKEIRDRNREIKAQYKAKNKRGKSPEEALQELAEEYSYIRDSIAHIVKRG